MGYEAFNGDDCRADAGGDAFNRERSEARRYHHEIFEAGNAALDAGNAASTAELHREYGETALADFLAGCEQAESTGHVESTITALCATARAKVDAASPEDRLEIQERALRLRMSTLK